MLSVQLLGPTQINFNGRPLSFRTNKVQALLCYLVVEAVNQPGVAFRREAVMELLWPDMSLKSAQDNLRQTLYQLRKTIPTTTADPAILADRLTITMNPAMVYKLDVAEFQKLLSAGSAQRNLEEAANLYRGDFLADFYLPDSSGFESWAADWRNDLRTKALACLERLTNSLTEQGQFDEAEGYARKQLEIDDLRESAYRQLMVALAKNGRRHEALQQYESCRLGLLSELDLLPAAETTNLYEQIRAGEIVATLEASHTLTPTERAKQRRHNLPSQTTSFVGRKQALAEVIRLLKEPDCRLLTLIGPGGIGKTRLSLQTAAQLAEDKEAVFADGVFLVPLAAVPNIDDIIAAIAEATGFSFSGPREPRSQLITYLKSKQLLLVLDNLEHLAKESALLADFLTAVPGLTFLVTSRVRLNLYEEWHFELKGLTVPPEEGAEQLENYSAVQLFLQRARQAGLKQIDETDLPVVGQICHLLAGLPLGIELAAGWVRTYSLRQIAAEIEKNIQFLSTRFQNVPARHQSLKIAFDQSWDLLAGEAQQVMASITIFRGGFDHEAAEFVTGASRFLLATLVDNSMLQMVDGRFQMNELLRQFGAEKLADEPNSELYNRHATYFATFLSERAQQRWTAEEPAVLNQISLEMKNIQAGWLWIIANLADPTQTKACLSLCSQYIQMLAYFYEQHNRFHEGVRLFQQVMEAITAVQEKVSDLKRYKHTLAKAKAAQASLRFHLGQYSKVESLLKESLAIFREQASQHEAAATLVILGMTHNRLGNFAEANHHLQESLHLFRQVEARVASAEALNGLGVVAISQERFEEGQQILQECLSIYEETGYQRGVARALNNQGTAYIRSGNIEPALPLYEAALEAARHINDAMVTAVVLSNMGGMAQKLGNYADSLGNYEESMAIFQEMDERRWIAVNLNGMGETLLDMGQIETAEAKLRQSLEMSKAIQSVPDSLDSLAGLGEIAALLGKYETAVHISAQVSHHSLSKPQARERAERILSEMKGQLPVDVWQSAKVHGEESGLFELALTR